MTGHQRDADGGAADEIGPFEGRMIRPLSDPGVGGPAPFLRQRFDVAAVTGAEILRITAHGLYIAVLNGLRVGADLLTPGWSAYDKRLPFQTYPVADLIRPGENVIEIWLGDGWFRSQLLWAPNALTCVWGEHVAALAEIRDGAGGTVLVATGEDWTSGTLPIVRNGLYFGEIYDARIESDGMHEEDALLPAPLRGAIPPSPSRGGSTASAVGVGSDSRRDRLQPLPHPVGRSGRRPSPQGGGKPSPVTAGVAEVPFDPSVLFPHDDPLVRELDPLPPVATTRLADGAVVYDFGQNASAIVAFTVRGARGARVIVEHAEITTRDGDLDNANYRSAECRIEYILAGTGEEHYRPHFTFQGFRYARVKIEGEAEIVAIASVPITSVPVPAAGFSCGNPLVDRLVLNTLWSQRSNFIEAPTDCPQRDERLGWTGDAQVFAGTACYLADCHRFLAKWLADVMADQREDGAVPYVVPDPTRLKPEHFPAFFGSTGWGDAITVVPWQLYLHYGDAEILHRTLPAMTAWVDYLWSISDGPIVRPPRGWGERGFTFGDWLQPKGPSAKPWPTIGDDAAATVYLHISARHAARAARVLGDEAVASRMDGIADAVRSAFAGEFVTPSGRLVGDDQTSYALALLHDLVPEDRREAAAGYFRASVHRTDRRIGTGFIGTPALLPALVEIGAADLAEAMLVQEDVPGWLYQVKMGATTIWERWDAIQPDGSPYDPGMNSYNHYAYGAVCQWLFERVAGFRPDPERPGFAHVILEPLILPSLSPVSAWHDAKTGRIAVDWSLGGDVVDYAVTVPTGSTATLLLPGGAQAITVDGTALGDGPLRLPLGPGRHVARFRQVEGV